MKFKRLITLSVYAVLITMLFSAIATAQGSSKVIIDNQRRLVINGKPFFPLGLYTGYGPAHAEEAHLSRISEAGFNTVLCYGYGDQENPREFLDRARKHGLWVIYSLKDHYTHKRRFPKGKYENGVEYALKEHVSKLKDHPALLAWYINDEEKAKHKDKVKALYDMIKREDPDHPVLYVVSDLDNVKVHGDATDIVAPDIYPINAPRHHNVPERAALLVPNKISLTKKILQQQNLESKSVWVVPQMFGFGIYWSNKGPHFLHMREPDFHQIRCMAYLGLIEGVQGMIFYSYQDLWRRPGRQNENEMLFQRRWAEMHSVGRELKQLREVLLNGNSWNVPKYPHPYPEIRISARGYSYGEHLFLLIANPEEEYITHKVVFDLPKGDWRVKRVLEGDVVAKIENNKLSVYIPPQGADTIVIGKVKP